MIFFLGQSVAGREDLLNPGAFFHWPLAYASRNDHKNAILRLSQDYVPQEHSKMPQQNAGNSGMRLLHHFASLGSDLMAEGDLVVFTLKYIEHRTDCAALEAHPSFKMLENSQQ